MGGFMNRIGNDVLSDSALMGIGDERFDICC